MSKTFGPQSTTDEVLTGIDLSDKHVLLTGVSAGLGVETARVLVSHGARVIGTARDLPKAERATEGVEQAVANGGSFKIIECDLASLKSIRSCADSLNAAGEPFDVVIANAGVMACPKGETEDGFETQFGTNHLGHFVLANRIASLIKPGGRLVILSSSAHRFSDVDLDDPGFVNTPYLEFPAYGRSKTANALFAVEFDRRHRSRDVRAVALHPGGIRTELMRHISAETLQQLAADTASAGEQSARRIKTVPQGAATTVWCSFVADADEIGGKYCEDCQVATIVDDPDLHQGVRSYALDRERATALWAKSEEMVGEHY